MADTTADTANATDDGLAFFKAAMRGDLDQLKALLRPGLDINVPPSGISDLVGIGWGIIPLHVAIEHNHTHIVGFLLAIGADVEALSRWKRFSGRALHIAARVPFPEIVALLLEAGADLYSEFEQAYHGAGTAILFVLYHVVALKEEVLHRVKVSQEHFETIHLLLDAGLNDNNQPQRCSHICHTDPTTVSLRSDRRRNPRRLMQPLLHQAVRCGNLDLVKMLISRGAMPSPHLIDSALQGLRDIGIVKYLLEDIGVPYDTNGLCWVAKPGRGDRSMDIELTRYFLSREQGLLGGSQTYSALCIAASYGPPELVQAFVDARVDVNGGGHCGDRPLHSAIRGPSGLTGSAEATLPILRALVESGADVNLLESREFGYPAAMGMRADNALHVCSHQTPPQVVQYLIEIGVDTETRNHRGCTPLLEMCLHAEYPLGTWMDRFVLNLMLLVKATTTVNAVDHGGNAVLHYLAQIRTPSMLVDVFAMLIRKGARADMPNNRGESAFELFESINGMSLQEFMLRECG